jgi:hypothetical protein
MMETTEMRTMRKMVRKTRFDCIRNKTLGDNAMFKRLENG